MNYYDLWRLAQSIVDKLPNSPNYPLVRVTHKPTGMICVGHERSRVESVMVSLRVIRARLFGMKIQEDWPDARLVRHYDLVNNTVIDYRTEQIVNDTKQVLDGDLSLFMEVEEGN